MGGCRCTYRNCTVKSDGKTHMFHYPVFEKVRCHQWLINAHKLEFLNLKVSQLKNRVVCQHHFKDENFMNFMKDRLTFDAIPTEDGPYCDTANYVDTNPDPSKLFPIIINDAENDYNDKKANYSLKYGDFLANLDLMDIEKIDEDNISYKNSYNTNVDILSTPTGRGKTRLFSEDSPFIYNISLPDKSDKKSLTYPILAVSPYKAGTDNNINNIQTYLKPKTGGMNILNDKKQNSLLLSNSSKDIRTIQPKPEPQKKEPKVKIISEKKVTDHVPIIGKFEPVSPNFILNVSKIKRKVISDNVPNNLNKCIENIESQNQDTNKTIEIELAPIIKDEDYPKPQPLLPLSPPPIPRPPPPPPPQQTVTLVQNSFLPERSPKVSVIKPRIPPERFEVIKKKRQFNMKLRDMVESCLDKLDNKPDEQSTPQKNTKPTTKLNKRKVQHVTSLSKDIPVLSSQEYTVAFLEARIRKMENALLEKIDQNSMKIVDLKNTFMKTSSDKKFAQIKPDDETHKRQLYQEISKYLSPSSRSIVYEELFINRFALNESVTSPKRKRRRRK